MKGININYKNSLKINLDSIKHRVLSNRAVGPIVIENKLILRTGDNQIYSQDAAYNYNINVTKRRRVGATGINTLPYGYGP